MIVRRWCPKQRFEPIHDKEQYLDKKTMCNISVWKKQSMTYLQILCSRRNSKTLIRSKMVWPNVSDAKPMKRAEVLLVKASTSPNGFHQFHCCEQVADCFTWASPSAESIDVYPCKQLGTRKLYWNRSCTFSENERNWKFILGMSAQKLMGPNKI